MELLSPLLSVAAGWRLLFSLHRSAARGHGEAEHDAGPAVDGPTPTDVGTADDSDGQRIFKARRLRPPTGLGAVSDSESSVATVTPTQSAASLSDSEAGRAKSRSDIH